jgi:serine/threonine-protein kinase
MALIRGFVWSFLFTSLTVAPWLYDPSERIAWTDGPWPRLPMRYDAAVEDASRPTRSLSDDTGSGEASDDLIGQFVGGYRVEARIGQGGMGVVYRAVHPHLRRTVAIKVILRGDGDDLSRQRFFDEARAVSRLPSPHVVEILDLATLPDGRSYILMEYLRGESLWHMMKRRGRFSPGDAVAVAAQVLSGLALAHQQGIVHRDIKPANLFVEKTPSGPRLKILDFGIATSQRDRTGPGLTRTGQILGTPGYMAPEQSSASRAVDARADLYSLGVILYELLAGKPPFSSDDWLELLQLHRSAEPQPLADAPPALAQVITRALAKEPDARFADAAAMRAALQTATEAGSVPDPEVAPEVAPVAPPMLSPTPRGGAAPPAEGAATVGQRPAARREAGPRVAEHPAPASHDTGPPSKASRPRSAATLGAIILGAVAAGVATRAFWPRGQNEVIAQAAPDATTAMIAVPGAAPVDALALEIIPDAGAALPPPSPASRPHLAQRVDAGTASTAAMPPAAATPPGAAPNPSATPVGAVDPRGPAPSKPPDGEPVSMNDPYLVWKRLRNFIGGHPYCGSLGALARGQVLSANRTLDEKTRSSRHSAQPYGCYYQVTVDADTKLVLATVGDVFAALIDPMGYGDSCGAARIGRTADDKARSFTTCEARRDGNYLVKLSAYTATAFTLSIEHDGRL